MDRIFLRRNSSLKRAGGAAIALYFGEMSGTPAVLQVPRRRVDCAAPRCLTGVTSADLKRSRFYGGRVPAIPQKEFADAGNAAI